MSSGEGGLLRGAIPATLRKTIKDIKEIASEHSDEDIYAMLTDCNMDPNETVQKLLFLDTFHEVKKKRDKRKSNVSIQAFERPRRAMGMHRQGARGWRGSNSSTYLSNDAGGRKQLSSAQENGRSGHTPFSADTVAPIHCNSQNDTAPCDTNSTNGSAWPASLSSESSVRERALHVSVSKVYTSHASPTEVNKLGKQPAPPSPIKQLQSSNAGSTLDSALTTTFVLAELGGYEGRHLESRSSDQQTSVVSGPVSGVYSSASDPVVVPSLNPRNPGAVGTIKRESGNLRKQVVSGPESTPNASHDALINGQMALRSSDPKGQASPGVESQKHSDHAIQLSLLNHDTTAAVIAHQEGWSAHRAEDSQNVMMHQGGIVSLGADMPSLPKVNDSVLEQATSHLNQELESLNISSHQPVIFPDHIQVPEAYRSGLTFGSLNGVLGPNDSIVKNAELVEETTLTNQDNIREPSLSHETPFSTARESEFPSHNPQSRTLAPENLSALEVNVSPAEASMTDLSKPETMPPIGGSPYPFLPPEYGYGILSPMLGPHLVQVEGAEVGNSLVPSTSGSSEPATQTVGVSPNAVSVSPQFSYLRQPYPSNYFPYSPYFPHPYMPPNAHQFLGHNGFAQQASTGNIYISQPTAATGVKFPIPAMYKSGNIASNLTHFGVPSGFGLYGSSSLGYGITPGSSSRNEDLTAPEVKENNMFSAVKQNEESQAWTMPGRDWSTLQGNFFYNIPQGQQIVHPSQSSQFSLPGMYHPTMTTAAPSIVHCLPQHCQAMVVPVDSMAPPGGNYQQSHSQISWNSKLLNRETM